MVPNKFPEPRWNEFPTYVYLLARSLVRTVWEDPSRDTCVGGGLSFHPHVRHGSPSFPPVR